VAELSRREFTFAGIFTVVALPGLVAAAALLLKQRVHPERSGGAAPTRIGSVAVH
jgi:AAHS family 4-hydroxybenzoate transporter-like MFS transporter